MKRKRSRLTCDLKTELNMFLPFELTQLVLNYSKQWVGSIAQRHALPPNSDLLVGVKQEVLISRRIVGLMDYVENINVEDGSRKCVSSGWFDSDSICLFNNML